MITIDDKILKQTPMTEGGEGIIFEYQDKIIKIYKDSVNKKEKLEKIKKLMGKKLPSNVVIPLDIVQNNKSKFMGYLMEKVNGEELKKLSNKKYIQVNNITIKDISKMLVEIKNTIIELHKQNIYISDFNDNNILFDKDFNVYFIDADSWTIDNIKCTVCMDTFKDPLLIANDFSNETDYYAYSVLVFKSLTRLHPFGGTMTPDINIIDRMKKRISVINNNKVTVPKSINKWNFIQPSFIEEFKQIFENDKRFLIANINDFNNNLKLCNKHNDYYYGKFKDCPICVTGTKLVTEKPMQTSTSSGIPYILLFSNKDVKLLLTFNAYINNSGLITNRFTKTINKVNKGERVYFTDDSKIVFIISDNHIKVKLENKSEYIFDKLYKTFVVIKNNSVYYVNKSNTLIELTITDKGNHNRQIAKVGYNTIFDVYNKEHYFVCSNYKDYLILNIDGYMTKIDGSYNIQNYGIHFDEISTRWLFILEDSKGIFTTFIYDKNNQKYINDLIKYSVSLNNICFNNKVIFIPEDKMIRGFSYDKNIFKDFSCEVVNEDSKLIREGNKFIVINEKEIYKLG
jgi:serine/threonine protein kinase